MDTKVAPRATLTFSVEGLAAREELLFKGYVRLLDHLTESQWLYQKPSQTQRVDLLVADERAVPTAFLPNASNLQPILQLGVSSTSKPFFLSWPLKPYELESELNRLGRMILMQRKGQAAGAGSTAAPLGNALPAPSTQPSQPQPQPQLYRLNQWPPARLLAEPGRMRLATLLTGRAMGLDEILHRSALAKSACERFLKDMQSAGLLVSAADIANHHNASARPHQPTQAQQLPAASSPAVKAPPARPAVQIGLLARIRMRLGINNAS